MIKYLDWVGAGALCIVIAVIAAHFFAEESTYVRPNPFEHCRAICSSFHCDLVGATSETGRDRVDRLTCTCYSIDSDQFNTFITEINSEQETSQ